MVAVALMEVVDLRLAEVAEDKNNFISSLREEQYMKKTIFMISLTIAACSAAFGQSAVDGYRISQPDLKGTARFMSMGGAFGALGGDLSTLSQNPAGIGVYRSNDVGVTVNLDLQSSTANAQGQKYSIDQTKFLLNNIGGVFTMRLPSTTLPNVNVGFTYNKGASFNRQYSGVIPNLNTSLSNYIAGVSNGEELTVGDVTTIEKNGVITFDPYNPNDNGKEAPWISILGFDSYLVTPSDDTANAEWYGQWGTGTSGRGQFSVMEKGSFDDFNIAFGGNIMNVVYWGMDFDIVNFNYTLSSIWGEQLDNAYVSDRNYIVSRTTADWRLGNYYNIHGSGFNYKLGVILKPIQELRIGVAFHTPTWMNLSETFGGDVTYNYGNGENGEVYTNQGRYGYNDLCFRTPWKFIGSIAGVIGSSFILSADYEYTPYNNMKFSDAGSYGISSGWDDGWYDDGWYDGPFWKPSNNAPSKAPKKAAGFAEDDTYYWTNSDIKTMYKATHTFRLGAEYRVTPAFSVRAGFSHVTSPVNKEVAEDKMTVYTSGTLPNYRIDNHTNYITCGLGYKYQKFYIDLAYVYKNMNSTYHAFTPDVNPDTNQSYPSPQAKLSLNNSQVVLSAGFRF